MNEAEWLTVVAPDAMLDWVAPRATDRKLRLLAVACCRRVARLSRARWLEGVLATAERIAEGAEEPPPESRPSPFPALRRDPAGCHLVRSLTGPSAEAAARAAAEWAAGVATRTGDTWQEKWFRAVLLCDILGNPFRPVALAPSWQTDTVLALARRVYDAREFSAMPILADALQDAGCDNATILDHCRDPQPAHARGCWVVDLVLGNQ
jgi:hypothetical protein